MSKKCFEKNCKEIPLFYCLCPDSPYICESHLLTHMFSIGDHTAKQLFIRPKDDEKGKIIDYIVSEQKIVKRNIQKVKAFSDLIIKMIITESNKIVQKLINYREMMDKQFKLIIHRSLADRDTLKKINFIKSNFQLGVEFDAKSIKNNVLKIFDLHLPNFYNPDEEDDEYAILFPSSTSRNVELIDLKSFKKTSIDMRLNEFSSFCLCCKIDSNKYFVYGGNVSGSGLSSVKIINIKEKSSVLLDPKSPASRLGGCYLENEIYVFGGWISSANTNECHKLNLLTNQWKSIQPLPEKNYRTSAYKLDSRTIFVCGFESSKIFSYNIKQNQFTTWKDTLPINTFKYLIRNWIICFGNFLYEIDDQENLISRQVFQDSGLNVNSSGYFKQEKFLYFLMGDGKLYRINTEAKIIEIVNYS